VSPSADIARDGREAEEATGREEAEATPITTTLHEVMLGHRRGHEKKIEESERVRADQREG
jgi:hypothetical protein